MITLILLIIGAVAIIIYTWYRVSLWRKRLKRETREAEESVKKSFKTLRKEIQDQIEYLDKRSGLSEEEKKIRDRLQKALKMSERFINKEIQDIEKELK